MPAGATGDGAPRRKLRTLPKAHLHLHFTGSMRHATVVELAAEQGVNLPDALTSQWPPNLSATDERGWFRFQRLYDVARSVLRTEEHVRRLVREAAEDDASAGSRWLELQVDPSGYAARFGGSSAFTDLVIDAARDATERSGVQVTLIIAANRTRHPLDARTLARLAVQYAGRGVVGFGLSNDERRGDALSFARAFEIAGRAGLVSAPHGGELAGPESVWACLDVLNARRIGHGVRSVEDQSLLDRLGAGDVTLEVCPLSNVALGVYDDPGSVPLRRLYDAGVPIALGADDPLLFGSRLVAQYDVARDVHGFSDAELAELARMSVRGSAAPSDVRADLLAAIDAWLAQPLTRMDPSTPAVGRPGSSDARGSS
ncbi:MAG: adenosine deaminase [Nocardioidaceae bacterium]|nr:adenosine deaminase [Nocardioidaceae bacterium]